MMAEISAASGQSTIIGSGLGASATAVGASTADSAAAKMTAKNRERMRIVELPSPWCARTLLSGAREVKEDEPVHCADMSSDSMRA